VVVVAMVVVVGTVDVVVVDVVVFGGRLDDVVGAAEGAHPVTKRRMAASPRRMMSTLTQLGRKRSEPNERSRSRFVRH
jgi:hypothetical protein